ncbi:MAG TPA: HAMP domain-containing sensor histidine kinase [Dehalococcoidia bacterium]|nr:HAMP domain-containing sensor histidine kinase [Dehalococcoidia bacterium]
MAAMKRKENEIGSHAEGRSNSAVILQLRQWQGMELMASIAHDMRTPLATITTSAELLEQNLGAEDGAHLVTVIQRQALRLHQMIQDLAEFISEPDGGIKLRSAVVDLGALVREVTSEFQHLHTSHHLTLELPMAKLPANIDSEKVRRIVQNLIGNACQYSPSGTTIAVRLRLLGRRQAVLEVDDEGVGIPKALRRKIFEPFYRIKDSVGHGQGLGLYIVRALAEAHGGSVWVEEAGAGGARFCVALPIRFSRQSSENRLSVPTDLSRFGSR